MKLFRSGINLPVIITFPAPSPWKKAEYLFTIPVTMIYELWLSYVITVLYFSAAIGSQVAMWVLMRHNGD